MGDMQTIAVFGATGSQGGGVVEALQNRGRFRVRALTRNPAKTADLGDEVRGVDLTDPSTVAGALDGVYGVFVNTNSFASPDTDEAAQLSAAVEGARSAGVEHVVWSTLPNVAEISAGEFMVPHFTNKARANAIVTAAGFRYHTFTEPPFYFQNLTSSMYPQNPNADGVPTISAPSAADARGMHMGDIREYGNLVAGVFENPELVGQGHVLSFAGDLLSWDEIVAVLRSQGHDVVFEPTSDDPFHIGDMFGYFAAHTYFGPDAATKTDLARKVTVEPFTDFATWAADNMTIAD